MFSLYFYPRPPGGGRPYHKRREMSIGFYFYPRPPGGGRPLAAPYRSGSSDFYPRPPGGGRRGKPVFAGFKLDKFLSTPSGWRATVKNLARAFNMSISIHALRVEGDRWWRKLFNQKSISIHALRVEGDKNGSGDRGDERDFYPRPPGGGRLVSFASRAFGVGFLSTPSGWRATEGVSRWRIESRISIHALRVEGDSETNAATSASDAISIHALRVEGDYVLNATDKTIIEFLSTPSGWRATCRESGDKKMTLEFLSTPSGWRATFNSTRVKNKRSEFLSTPSGWRATYHMPPTN